MRFSLLTKEKKCDVSVSKKIKDNLRHSEKNVSFKILLSLKEQGKNIGSVWSLLEKYIIKLVKLI